MHLGPANLEKPCNLPRQTLFPITLSESAGYLAGPFSASVLQKAPLSLNRLWRRKMPACMWEVLVVKRSAEGTDRCLWPEI